MHAEPRLLNFTPSRNHLYLHLNYDVNDIRCLLWKAVPLNKRALLEQNIQASTRRTESTNSKGTTNHIRITQIVVSNFLDASLHPNYAL